MNRKNLMLLGSSLLLLAPSASGVVAILDNGDINAGATWDGGAAPMAGDTNQWDTGTLTVKTGTQTFEGQELRVQTGGRLATGAPGPTLTMAGDLTLDGGTITVLNNNPFIVNLNSNTFNLNSGILDSGGANTGRDLIFTAGSLAGSGAISIQGGASAARSAVIFQNSVTTSNFTGSFEVISAANFFLPAISIANASFGIDVNGSGQIGLTEDYAVTSAVFDGLVINPGTYDRGQLLALGVNSNRVLAAGADSLLTVVPEPSAALLGGLGLLGLLRRRRA